MQAPETLASLLAALRELGPEKLARQFSRRPLSSDLLREAYQAARDGDLPGATAEAVPVFLTGYPLAPSDLLERLRADCQDQPALLARLAAHPRTSPEQLADLLAHPAAEVRAAAAQNPQLSPRQLGELAADRNEVVQLAAVRHKALKAQHQAALLMSRHPSVRAALAGYPKLETELAVALTADPSPAVRFALGSRGHAGTETLAFWADRDDLELQLGLLERGDLPSEALHSLLLSPHGAVRRRAAELCDLDLPYLILLIEQGDVADHAMLAARQDLPEPLFETLATVGSPEVLRALARNPALPSDLAHRLCHAEESLLLAVLENPTHRHVARDALHHSGDDALRALLVYLPETDDDALARLVNDALCAGVIAHAAFRGRPAPALRADLAFALSQHKLPSLRAWALDGHDFPTATLERLAEDPAPAVAAAARHQLSTRTNEAAGGVFAEGADLPPLLERLARYLSPSDHHHPPEGQPVA